MLKIGDKRLALWLATSWSGYSSDRGLSNLTAVTAENRRRHLTVSVPPVQLSRLGWVTCLTPTCQNSILSSLTVRQLSISAAVAAEAQIADKPMDAKPLAEATPAVESTTPLQIEPIVEPIVEPKVEPTVEPSVQIEATTAEPATIATEAETPELESATPAIGAASSASEPAAATEVFFLPDKPVPSGSGLTIEFGAGVDPPLEAVGLGSWWPSGRVQVLLDYFHNSLDIPWCGAIVIATVCMRLLIFPLVVMAQKNMALLNNHNTEMTKYQEKMSIARQRGDVLETTRAGAEMQQFMTEKGINPLKNVVPILGQLPIFMSMFFGLRGLANLPLESMENGGIAWFADLTIPDPYYGLPLMLCTTTFLQFKMGADGMGAHGSKSPIIKYVMMGLPFIMFPMTMNFVSAVTFYWSVNNFISLCQARLIRTPALRTKLGIPQMIIKPKDPNAKNVGFKQTLKDSIANFRAQSEIIDRREHDERVFREIGSAKPKRTYKFDPTKSALKKR